MSYDELLAQVYAALPQLKGQLHAPRVVYVQSQGKVYITFESNVLVEEASFLKLEALLRRVFPQKPLALRVVSPGLKDDFLENISAYKQVLTDFLRRNYPASASWMSQIDWRCDGKRITLTFPDAFSLEYMGRQNVAARLSQAVKDIFSAEVMVELTVAGDQEKRLAEIREEIARADRHLHAGANRRDDAGGRQAREGAQGAQAVRAAREEAGADHAGARPDAARDDRPRHR